jgi:tyrosyl-tRNA synthetase
MRHFQDLGHDVVFLIGDFTGLVGDPTGVSKTRPRLTRQEIEENARTYKAQVSKVLDAKKLRIAFNSKWLDRMTPYQLAELAARQTVARVLERDDFARRYKSGQDISFLEFLYPLFQAYDSVELKADIELGGSDQKFNMLMGRTIQERYGQEPQVVITMPLLEGMDGVQKMSKSLSNYVGINEPAKEIFGKLMSISDELMFKYYELLTDEDTARIKSDVTSGTIHPKEAKVHLSKLIVAQYHSAKEADRQAEEFERAFKDKDFPQDVKLTEISIAGDAAPLVTILADHAKLLPSRSEAKRKIQEGAVEVDGVRVLDIGLEVKASREYRLRVGKRFARIFIEKIKK